MPPSSLPFFVVEVAASKALVESPSRAGCGKQDHGHGSPLDRGSQEKCQNTESRFNFRRTLKEWQQAFRHQAGGFFGCLRPGDIQKRGVEINVRDRHITMGARLNHTGPTGDRRFTDATFVITTLVAPQGFLARIAAFAPLSEVNITSVLSASCNLSRVSSTIPTPASMSWVHAA